jgi:hypothetical protein
MMMPARSVNQKTQRCLCVMQRTGRQIIFYLCKSICTDVNFRDKITMPFLDFPSTAGRPLRSRSNVRTVRRSFVITRTRKPQREARRMIASSNAFKKLPRFSLILLSVGNSIQLMRLRILNHLQRSKLKKAISTNYGARSSKRKDDFLESSPCQN